MSKAKARNFIFCFLMCTGEMGWAMNAVLPNCSRLFLDKATLSVENIASAFKVNAEVANVVLEGMRNDTLLLLNFTEIIRKFDEIRLGCAADELCSIPFFVEKIQKCLLTLASAEERGKRMEVVAALLAEISSGKSVELKQFYSENSLELTAKLHFKEGSGDIIKKAIKDKKTSQHAVALYVGITQKQMSHWINKQELSKTTTGLRASKLLKFLDLNPSDVFIMDNPKN